jgi:hypothetical protein
VGDEERVAMTDEGLDPDSLDVLEAIDLVRWDRIYVQVGIQKEQE